MKLQKKIGVKMELNNFVSADTKGKVVWNLRKTSASPLSNEHDYNWLIVEGIWDDRLIEFMATNNVDAICLNTALGWRTRDYSFLADLESIKSLEIIAGGDNLNLDALERMPSLCELNIAASTKCVVDFSKATKLRECFLNWWAGAESIFEANWLTDLAIDEIRRRDFAALSNLKSLERLALSNTNVDSLDFLAELKSLEVLELLNCRKISTFDPISQLKALRWLRIDGTKYLPSISFITNCKNLEILTVSDCGGIDTLRPVEALKELKALAFAGNTKIVDGDLECLMHLPKLAMLMFASRRHYSHTQTKKWDWDNFEIPDIQLKSKS
jgi:Leucine-rich repeat (LRR) protein